MPHSAIANQTRRQARTLRKGPTDAERKIWQVLRSLKPLGVHFRRQAPIGSFIADFAWYAGRLVVEIDGGQHAQSQRAYDERRTSWVKSQGYRVLRFWNNDVLKSPHDIGEAILAAVRESGALSENPTPDPSPQGGGERAGASGKDMVR
jgi:very-short-patch-repair endonuclease